MKKLKFAAGITLYNPEISSIERVNQYLNSFDIVLVFDNSDKRGREYERVVGNLSKDNRLVYLDGKGNEGLPCAYNIIMADKHIADFDYICTLDQDSVFEFEDIEIMKRYIEINQSELRTKVAEIGPYIDYGKQSDIGHKIKNRVENRGRLITSGAFVNLYLYRNGKFTFDENYFIDKFEIDLCKQFTNAGFKVLMYHASVLHQRFGEESGHDHPNHSPLRHYYLFRNRFYFNKKFYSVPKRWALNILQTARHVMLIGFFEDNKLNKIKSLGTAVLDYQRGRMKMKRG